MRRIDATIYFGNEGARKETTIFVEDNATNEQIAERLEEEALSYIEYEWYECVTIK